MWGTQPSEARHFGMARGSRPEAAAGSLLAPWEFWQEPGLRPLGRLRPLGALEIVMLTCPDQTLKVTCLPCLPAKRESTGTSGARDVDARAVTTIFTGHSRRPTKAAVSLCRISRDCNLLQCPPPTPSDNFQGGGIVSSPLHSEHTGGAEAGISS